MNSNDSVKAFVARETTKTACQTFGFEVFSNSVLEDLRWHHSVV